MESRTLLGNLDRARCVSPRTLRDDREYIRTLCKFFNGIPLGKFHEGHLACYATDRALKAGPGKINQELGMLRLVLREAGLWTAEMQKSYHRLPVPYCDVPRAMSPEEQSQFLRVAASRQEWELVYWFSLLALDTALRHCELRGLHRIDVKLMQGTVKVRAEHAKNVRAMRTIDLTREATWALENLLHRACELGATEPEHYLFPFCVVNERRYDPRRPMSNSGMKRGFDAVRKAAGVPWLRIYDLRHCAITRLAEGRMHINDIMERVGHSSPRMTQHYTHISRAASRHALEEFEERRTVRLGPMAVKTGER